MMKVGRFFFLFLVLCLLCTAVVACGGDGTGTPEITDFGSGSETRAENGSDEDSTTGKYGEEPLPEGSVLLSDLEKMQIVYDADGGDEFLTLAKSLQSAIQEKTGLSLKVYPDAFYAEKEYEIVLGACVGRACEAALNALRVNDYFCSVDGTKITLGAISESALSQAVTHFLTNAVDAYEENDRDLFCNKADAEIVFADTYAVDTLTVGGVNITDYVIVYPKKVPNYENEYAERLAAKIEEISGYRIPVYKDSQEWSAAHELHIGLTSSDDAYAEMLALETDAYVIEKVENKVILAASTVSGYVAGSDVLLAMLSAENAVEKTIAIDFSEKITAIGNDLSVKVMSYNIYYSMLVEPRMSHVIEMIEKHDPDVLGVQEAMPEWKEYLAEHLGDVYGIVGEGRGGGNNDEHNLILYRKDQFDLVESGTWWLSATPEVPSKYSASSLNRIVTYAVLERKHDGKKFVHFNTHLEHTSAEARDLQVEVLLNIAGEYTEYPRFMTGDFNAKKNANVVQRILESGYSDSYDVAKNAVYDPTSPSSTVVIDYCFVSTDLIQVEKYRVDTFHYNIEEKDPSDHNPVIVDLIIK